MSVVIVGNNTPTAGGIAYGDGTNIAFNSAGTSGQVLTSAGSSAPTWATPVTGAMTLVSTQTASSSASLSWTGLSGNRYRLILENILNNGSNLFLQLGYGSTTWITTGYAWVGPYVSIGGSVSSISSSTASNSGFFPKYYTSSTGFGMSVADLTGFTNGVAQSYTNIEHSYTGSNWNYTSTSGALSNANNITAVRLISSSGNIASGSASLYLISS